MTAFNLCIFAEVAWGGTVQGLKDATKIDGGFKTHHAADLLNALVGFKQQFCGLADAQGIAVFNGRGFEVLLEQMIEMRFAHVAHLGVGADGLVEREVGVNVYKCGLQRLRVLFCFAHLQVGINLTENIIEDSERLQQFLRIFPIKHLKRFHLLLHAETAQFLDVLEGNLLVDGAAQTLENVIAEGVVNLLCAREAEE